MNSVQSESVNDLRPTVEEMRAIPVFSDLSPEQLEWLTSQMELVLLEPGQVFLREGSPADRLFVMFEGEVRGQRESDGAGSRVYIARAGQVTGLLPYSRLTHFPVAFRAITNVRAGTLLKEHFPEMLKRIPVLAERLVGLLSDRIREATKVDQQREKLMALGKLSAGLAHELNNPAAAARRAADTLRQSVNSLRSANLRLMKRGLDNTEARIFLAHLECDWAAQTGPQEALDTLERSDLEEKFAAWLQKRNVPQAWDLAATLVDTGCKLTTLDEVAARVSPELLGDVLTRLTASFSISRLVEEIESSTGKISELVRAVKEYSYMDQMPEQDVDVHAGIENTLIMLKYRLKHGVSILRDYDRTIPLVCARGSELNQVWTNLIANAVDAMEGKGELRIRTAGEPNCALVEIIDNGPGIPAEIQTRIFEPFFTTKGAGEGTGLGLDAVFRIVQNHRGDVRFESQPGETRFQVRIPYSKAREEKV